MNALFRAATFAAVASAIATTPAAATVATVFNSVSAGEASFDATVAAAGGTASVQVQDYDTSTYTDFSVSKTAYYGYSYINGYMTDIAPAGDGTVEGTRASGVKFTFNTAINSFGLDVGDWGTCCQPSSLYIAFDGGPAIKVGTSLVEGDVYLTNGYPSVFVGAFDDGSSFSSVEFWGDGLGEVLYGGGTIRYALLDKGALPDVPEPASWAMMLAGFGAIGGAMRSRRKAAVSFG